MAKSAAAPYEQNDTLGKLKAWPARGKSFLSDVRTELRHVTAPSRKEVQATTVVVVITVALFGVFFFLTDFVIAHGMDLILKHKF
jgi:preprotein translocase subunit SecE